MNESEPIEPQPKTEDLDFKKLIWLQINRVNMTKPRGQDFFFAVDNLVDMVRPWMKTTGKSVLKQLEEKKNESIQKQKNEFEQNKELYKYYRKLYALVIYRLKQKGWALGGTKVGGDAYNPEKEQEELQKEFLDEQQKNENKSDKNE